MWYMHCSSTCMYVCMCMYVYVCICTCVYIHIDDQDLGRLRNYALAEGVDASNLRALVAAILLDGAGGRRPAGSYTAVPVAEEAAYDMSKESMAAVMGFLEQHGVLATLNDSFAHGALLFTRSNQDDLQRTSAVVDAIVRLLAQKTNI